MSVIGSFTSSFARALEDAEENFGKDEFQFYRGKLAGMLEAWGDLEAGNIKESIFPDLIHQYGRRSNFEIESLFKKFKLKKYLDYFEI